MSIKMRHARVVKTISHHAALKPGFPCESRPERVLKTPPASTRGACNPSNKKNRMRGWKTSLHILGNYPQTEKKLWGSSGECAHQAVTCHL